MFRRKEEGDLLSDAGTTSDTTTTTSNPSDTGSSSTSGSSVGSSSAATSATTSGASMYTPARPAEAPKPAGNMPGAATGMYRPAPPAAPTRNQDFRGASSAAPSSSPSGDKTGKTNRRILTVGNDILLKGEIATCDRLVIEGKVDATLKDVHTVEIAESGSFKGNAEIEDAEISGLFEGELVVRNRLVIYSSGQVRGKITYGEIEIERGGELTGEIKTVSAAGNKSGSGNKFGDNKNAA